MLLYCHAGLDPASRASTQWFAKENSNRKVTFDSDRLDPGSEVRGDSLESLRDG